MKHFTHMLAALFVAASLFATACSKDDDDKLPTLTGTTWATTLNNSFTDEDGDPVNFSGTVSLTFTSTTEGIAAMSMAYVYPDNPEENSQASTSAPFTYTTSGNKVTMKAPAIEEDMDGNIEYNWNDVTVTTLTYKESGNKFIYPLDEEDVEYFGTTTLTLTQLR